MGRAQQFFVGLGGNLGPVATTLQQAVKAIEGLAEVKAVRCSGHYRTAPVSSLPQPDYLNAVCCGMTTLSPLCLLQALQAIEKSLGKRPKSKEAPRPIDLDLLFYEQETFSSNTLTLPHPRWQERLFVVAPLYELVDEIVLPGGQTVDLADLKDHLSQSQAHWVTPAEQVPQPLTANCSP